MKKNLPKALDENPQVREEPPIEQTLEPRKSLSRKLIWIIKYLPPWLLLAGALYANYQIIKANKEIANFQAEVNKKLADFQAEVNKEIGNSKLKFDIYRMKFDYLRGNPKQQKEIILRFIKESKIQIPDDELKFLNTYASNDNVRKILKKSIADINKPIVEKPSSRINGQGKQYPSPDWK